MVKKLNIKANRASKKYSSIIQFKRLLWMLGRLAFRYSFRNMFAWRNFILKLFGARIGSGVHIYNSATIYMPWHLRIGNDSAIGEHAYIYNLGRVKIGSQVTISHKAHLCAGTHDYRDPTLPLLKPTIKIANNAWICADAYVGPGVKIAEGSVIGARAVVTKNTEAWVIYAGNPAKAVNKRVLNNA